MTPLLEVRQLTKRFPIAGSRSVVQAVNGISFTLAPGETLGLVGESGSGKTTVGRCILGLADISGGSITFDGADLSLTRRRNPASLRGQVQIVFQEPADALGSSANLMVPRLVMRHEAHGREADRAWRARNPDV